MSGLFAELDGCGAELSPDGVYRYTLTRQWGDGPCVTWLMFNPSTADAAENDATIRKCIGFSKRWEYGRMVVVNLFAVRNRNPRAVARICDPIGPMNNWWMLQALRESRELVCAWGCGHHFPKGCRRIEHVAALFADDQEIQPICLGVGKDGNPKHPLILAYDTPREPFSWTK